MRCRCLRLAEPALFTGAPFRVPAAFSLAVCVLVRLLEPSYKTQEEPAAPATRRTDGLTGGSLWTRLDG